MANRLTANTVAEVLRSSLEGGFQESPRHLKGSFEASATRTHLGMWPWLGRSSLSDHGFFVSGVG